MLRGLECCNAFLPTRRNATDGCFEQMLFRDKRKKLVVSNLAYSAKSAYLCSHQREGRHDHRASLISKYARSGCSTVGSAPRSGRGGRKFESSHPDNSCLQVICRQLFFCYRGVLPMAADYNSEKRLAAKPGRLRRCVYTDNML